MRRIVSWTAVLLTALVLQSTVFAQVRLADAKPELVYLATICLAYLEGPSSGALGGFFGGMAEDFLLNAPKGITALTLTLMGYGVGTLRQYVTTPSRFLPVLVVAGATAAGIMFNQLVTFLLGHLEVTAAYVVRVAVLSGVYNGILTPMLFPVIRRVTEASRSRRVFRW